MDKNFDTDFKDFLNSNENIEVPNEISRGIDNVLKRIEKQRNRQKWFIRSSIAVASILFMIFGIGAAFPTFADQIPVIDKILGKQSLFNKGAVNNNNYQNVKNVQNNSVAVEKTSTDSGVSVSLKEIAYDGTSIYVIYQAKGDIPTDKVRDLGTITIGGKKYDFDGESIIGIQKIDDNTVQVVQMFLIGSQNKLSDKFDVSINFNEMQWKSGTWKFDMKLDKNELSKTTKHFDINKQISLKSGKIYIASLIQSATFATLTVDYDNYKSDRDFMNCSLIDNTGTELQQIDFSKVTKIADKTEVITMYNVSQNTKIKKLIVNQSKSEFAYPEKISNKTYVAFSDTFPKTISIGKGKEIIINKVEEDNYITTVNKVPIKHNSYELIVTAKGLSMQNYVSNGGITAYGEGMDKKNYDSYNLANSYVQGTNTYKIRFLGDITNAQAIKKNVAIVQYDDILQQVAKIDIN